jgi:hypothetical protein
MGGKPNVEYVWHGTNHALCARADCRRDDCSLCQIAEYGYQPSRARNFGTSYARFGSACYFGDNAAVAHNYNGQSEEVLGEGHRTVILSRVALGRSFHVPDDHPPLLHPPVGHDSITVMYHGLTSRAERLCLQHFLIYDAPQAVPMFVVQYRYPRRYKEVAPWMEELARMTKCGHGQVSHDFCPFHKMRHGNQNPVTAPCSCDGPCTCRAGRCGCDGPCRCTCDGPCRCGCRGSCRCGAASTSGTL